jgi:flagellar basal-body rod protein FlgG
MTIACTAVSPSSDDPSIYTKIRPVEAKSTDNQLDLAIDGGVVDSWSPDQYVADFFILSAPDGTPRYTRWGAFKLNTSRAIVSEKGFALSPRIVIPADATDIHVREDGLVLIRRPSSEEQEDVGIIFVARFPLPGGLQPAGDGLYMAPVATTGRPSVGRPATGGRGRLLHGALDPIEAERRRLAIQP